jgi:hypothetical protein
MRGKMLSGKMLMIAGLLAVIAITAIAEGSIVAKNILIDLAILSIGFVAVFVLRDK